MAISLLTAAQQAASYWLCSGGGRPEVATDFSLVPIRPGMSGAAVYDCRLADGRRYALKSWPAGIERAHVQQVHQVITWARHQGCEFVPELSATAAETTVVLSGGRLWELAEWMPGQPLTLSASPAEIQAGAAAVARFHASAAELGVSDQPPPAVAARLRRLQQLGDLLPRALQPTRSVVDTEPVLAETLGRAGRLLGEQWPAAAERVTRGLAPWADAPIATQYVLRDIHREHLLFGGGNPASLAAGTGDRRNVTGLIDFDAVRIDTPASDLARWVSDFLVGRRDEAAEEVWRAAVAGFEQVRPFAIQHQRLARELVIATSWISLANWLVWLNVERRQFPAGPEAVAKRIEHLLELMGWHPSTPGEPFG